VSDAVVVAFARAAWVRETDPLYPDSWGDQPTWVRGPYVMAALRDLEAALPVLCEDAKQRILEATGHALTDEEAQWYADVAFGLTAAAESKETA
jgi:hypothetical protein